MTLPGTEPGNYRTASPIEPGHVAAAGCLRWRWVFPGREDQVRELRRWLAGLLPGAPARDDVVLVAVELVTNAVRHTASGHGGLVMVEVTWYGPVVRVAVADGGAPHGPQILAGPGGRRIDGDYQVTAFDRPRRLEFQVIAGPARPVGVFELTEQADQSTRVRFALSLKPAGLMRLMTPMIARQMQREVAQLDNLKAILERRP